MADFHGDQAKKNPKFHGLVLGLVGLIDAKDIDLAQPWESVKQGHKLKY